MQHFEIFKCFYGLSMDWRDWYGPPLYLTDAEGKEKTLPAVNRKFPTVDQQDQRWRAEWCLYDLHNSSTFDLKCNDRSYSCDRDSSVILHVK